jgi:hypothetical protein
VSVAEAEKGAVLVAEGVGNSVVIGPLPEADEDLVEEALNTEKDAVADGVPAEDDADADAEPVEGTAEFEGYSVPGGPSRCPLP